MHVCIHTPTRTRLVNSGAKKIDLLLRIIFYVFLTTVMTVWKTPHVVASKCSWNHVMRNTTLHNPLSHISFKTVPLYSYTLLSATVRVLETFLEVIS